MKRKTVLFCLAALLAAGLAVFFLVRGSQGLGIFEINFVLALCNFVVRCFNIKSHFLKCADNISSDVFAQILRSYIVVSCVVVNVNCLRSVRVFNK